jgi:hypothetical protein
MIFSDRCVLPVRIEPSNESRVAAAVETADAVAVEVVGEEGLFIDSLSLLTFCGVRSDGVDIPSESRVTARGDIITQLLLLLLLLLSNALSASATESTVEERALIE